MEDRIVFLKGRKTVLRPLMKADAPSLARWMNDEEVRQYVSNYLPKAVPFEEEWIASLDGKAQSDIVLAIETHEGTLIGTMGLHRINWKDRTAKSGAMIGEKKFWNQGYGQDAKMQLLHYAFDTLNLRKICSEALAYNKRSIGHNLACGYKQEGVKKKQTYIDGHYHDHILLAVFRKDWLPYWKKYCNK
jgi:RimJ/RimL family protein N-acetyltransferase